MTFDFFRTRLLQPLPGTAAHAAMFPRVVPMPAVIPQNARHSAVLALLHPRPDGLVLTLMQRTEDRSAHSRQISLPGGRQEPGEDLETTALRETFEELGLRPEDIEVAGPLSPLYIPVRNFRVHPFLGFLAERPAYSASPAEVAAVLEVPLSHFLLPEARIITDVTSPAAPDVVRQVQAYLLPGGEILWGATAMIVAELAALAGEPG